MSLETKLSSLVAAIGGDIKTILTSIGNLASLTSTDKTSLVLAINSVKADITAVENSIANSAGINDNGSTTSTTETYSINKITNLLTTLEQTVKSDILGSAPATLDTLQELASALSDNPSFATDIATSLGHRVRFDAAQSLDSTQQATARTNINAASDTDFQALITGLGNYDADIVTLYNNAKA